MEEKSNKKKTDTKRMTLHVFPGKQLEIAMALLLLLHFKSTKTPVHYLPV